MRDKYRPDIFIGGFMLFYFLFIVVGGLSELLDFQWLRFVIDYPDGMAVFASPIPFLIIYVIMYFAFKWIHPVPSYKGD